MQSQEQMAEIVRVDLIKKEINDDFIHA